MSNVTPTTPYYLQTSPGFKVETTDFNFLPFSTEVSTQTIRWLVQRLNWQHHPLGLQVCISGAYQG